MTDITRIEPTHRLSRLVVHNGVAYIQAALLGLGIALGWLNSTAYWLSTGAAPACEAGGLRVGNTYRRTSISR